MARARLTDGLKGRFHPFISAATVPSVLGPVDGEALGFVLPHEHLTIDNRVHHAPSVTTPRRLRAWDR